VILLGGRFAVQLLDQRGDLLLVRQHLLEEVCRRAEIARRLRQRLQRHAAVAVLDEVEELHGVLALFFGLQAHPMGESGEVLSVAIC
jgi:hypothetical protein